MSQLIRSKVSTALSRWKEKTRPSRSGPLRVRKACFYDPFWQTDSVSPWNVNQLLTVVLGGAPK